MKKILLAGTALPLLALLANGSATARDATSPSLIIAQAIPAPGADPGDDKSRKPGERPRKSPDAAEPAGPPRGGRGAPGAEQRERPRSGQAEPAGKPPGAGPADGAPARRPDPGARPASAEPPKPAAAPKPPAAQGASGGEVPRERSDRPGRPERAGQTERPDRAGQPERPGRETAPGARPAERIGAPPSMQQPPGAPSTKPAAAPPSTPAPSPAQPAQRGPGGQPPAASTPQPGLGVPPSAAQPGPRGPAAPPPSAATPPAAAPAPTAQPGQRTPPPSAAQPGPGVPSAPPPSTARPAEPTPPPPATGASRPGQPPAPAGTAPPSPPAASSGVPTVRQGEADRSRPRDERFAPGVTINIGRDPRIDELRGLRRERVEDGGRRTVIEEPGDRRIIREGNRTVIIHDETDRFRRAYEGADVRTERRGTEEVTIVRRPNGVEIVTVRDEHGNLIRRVRREPNRAEVVLIENVVRTGPRRTIIEETVELPPPVLRIPREKYVVEVERASQEDLYEAFTAPPVERIERSYSLEEVRRSPSLRQRVRRVDVDTVTFETGSWTLAPDQIGALTGVATAVRRAIETNPNEIFLIEGHTDAVGPDVDNLTLSDRRAETVATILSERFQIPAENLTTQGYGEQYLKVNSQGPQRENRRVTLSRITPLLRGQT